MTTPSIKNIKIPFVSSPSKLKLQNVLSLRVRFFVIFVLLVSTLSLHADNFNSPRNVDAIGYETLSSNGIYSIISKTGFGNSSSSVGKLAQGIASIPSDFRFINDTDPTSQTTLTNIQGVVNSEIQLSKSRPLKDLIAAPDSPRLQNFLVYPKYNINVPIIYAGLKDLFQTNSNGDLLKDNKGNFVPYEENIPRDGPLGVPIQRLLVDGIVHIGFTALPGEIGNSYIVGHSSNFSSVQSSYNYIFKPLESRSEPGEEFIVYDKSGRELKFKVFETKEILEADVTEAYKIYGDRRVVTLQCSILEYVNGTLQPTKRWLTRGELVLE